MTNNSVCDGYGVVKGYRCHQCGGVFQMMWGVICNKCRREEERHQEMINAIKNKPKAVEEEI